MVNTKRRELIDTGHDKRYACRNKLGQFTESDDVSKSLRKDIKQSAKRVVKSGYRDKGDQRRRR
jgi:hypothetical protein